VKPRKAPPAVVVGLCALVLFEAWQVREVRSLSARDEARCEGRGHHDPDLPVRQPVPAEGAKDSAPQPAEGTVAGADDVPVLVRPALVQPEPSPEPLPDSHSEKSP